MKTKMKHESTARKGHKMTLFFEADPNNDLKGVLHDTESVMFNNRSVSALETITDFTPKWRTGLFGVN